MYASYGIARLLSILTTAAPGTAPVANAASTFQSAVDAAPSSLAAGNFTVGLRNATYSNQNTAITVSVPAVVPAYPLPGRFTAVVTVQGARSAYGYVAGVISSWVQSSEGSCPLDITQVLGIASVSQGGVGDPDLDTKIVPQYAVTYNSVSGSSGSGSGGVPLLYFFLALIGAAAMGLCVGLFVARFFLRPPPLPSIKQQLLDVPMLAS